MRSRSPATLSLTQVYFAADRRGPALARDAQAAADALRRGTVAAADAPALGDAFVAGASLTGVSRDQLGRIFGADFAGAVWDAPVGVWVGPVASSYGLHLVRIVERTPGRVPTLAAVRSRVLQALLHERRVARRDERAARAARALCGAGRRSPTPSDDHAGTRRRRHEDRAPRAGCGRRRAAPAARQPPRSSTTTRRWHASPTWCATPRTAWARSTASGSPRPAPSRPRPGCCATRTRRGSTARPLLDDLVGRLGRPVRIENDANCFALSEAVDGAGAGHRVVFGVILGTGVGAGITVGGTVLCGPNRIAGEWGHNPLPWSEETERPGPALLLRQAWLHRDVPLRARHGPRSPRGDRRGAERRGDRGGRQRGRPGEPRDARALRAPARTRARARHQHPRSRCDRPRRRSVERCALVRACAAALVALGVRGPCGPRRCSATGTATRAACAARRGSDGRWARPGPDASQRSGCFLLVPLSW